MFRRVRDLVVVLLWGGFALALVLDPVEPWPFSTWPMFRHARGPGWEIRRVSVQAIDEQGERVAAVRPDGWRRQAMNALSTHSELRPDLLRALAASWADSHPDPARRLVRLELWEERYRFTPSPVLLQSVVIATVDL